MFSIELFQNCYLCIPESGSVAEWLGRGLQNLVRRFESARDLLIGNITVV